MHPAAQADIVLQIGVQQKNSNHIKHITQLDAVKFQYSDYKTIKALDCPKSQGPLGSFRR